MLEKHTFEHLDQLSFNQLERVRDTVRGTLHDKMQERYQLIAQILWYEAELEKLDASKKV